jgi:hypothetical protein
MKGVAHLKERVLQAEAERDHLQSLLDTFFSGDIPESASMQHFILAKWGRKRLEEMRKKPAILRPSNT